MMPQRQTTPSQWSYLPQRRPITLITANQQPHPCTTPKPRESGHGRGAPTMSPPEASIAKHRTCQRPATHSRIDIPRSQHNHQFTSTKNIIVPHRIQIKCTSSHRPVASIKGHGRGAPRTELPNRSSTSAHISVVTCQRPPTRAPPKCTSR